MQEVGITEADTMWSNYAQDFSVYLQRTEFTSKINELVSSNKHRLILNLDHMRQTSPDLVKILFDKPSRSISLLETSLKTICHEARGSDPSAPKKKLQGSITQKEPTYTVGFEGNFGKYLITPRGLNSNIVNKLVAVKGIVTRMSYVRPKLVHSVHYCDVTRVGRVKEYRDQYSISFDNSEPPSSNAYPTKDENNNPLTTEYGFCHYRDYQTLLLQEMPEKAPTGLIPQSVEVILQDDLVDKAKPGDRVQIVGVYKTITTGGTTNNAIFKTVIMATNIVVSASELETPVFSAEDVRNIKEISKRDDLFKLLSHSIAPSIYGHEYIKKAILLMLLGGVEKNLENKTHLRGDINILMVGDPSTAKSQLLRRVLSISPLAINTTGRGSSGVGLTAAVVYDKETGDRHLEAGAMVLADRGIVCIDEFDKMEEADRVAIHEVMEQQTVTIAKAGIHTSLNARCSVIAAANPIYGEYQKDLPPTKNIGLPDSLLSRFDFLFIVLDEKDPKIDRMIAERVTRNHRYIHPSQEDNHLAGELDDDYVLEPDYNERADDAVFEKYNSVMHGSEKTELVTQQFLKKYIFYAKKTIVPVLTEEAVGFISNAWTTLRQKDAENTLNNGPKKMAITIRTLETLIRIATAHAKLRISKQVEQRDCEVALELLLFALFEETPQDNHDDDEAMFDEDDDDDNDNGGRGGRRRGNDNRRQQQKRDQEYRQPSAGKKSTTKETEIVTEKPFTRSQLREKEETKASKESIGKKSSKKPEDKEGKMSIQKEGTISTTKDGKTSTTKDGKVSVTKKEMDSLSQRLKKTKLTSADEEDVEGLLTMSISSSIEINDEAKKYVHKLIHDQFASVKDLLDDLLWETIKEQQSTMPPEAKKVLKRKEALVKVLMVLDDENRIMYKPEDKIIHKL